MPTPQPGHSAGPRRRSLADELRSWTPARLADLLAARPDLAVPPPTSVAALAERASQRASVGLAMDRLDAFSLQVLQALAVSPEPVTADSTASLLGLGPDDPRVGETINALRSLALLWGPDTAIRPLVNAREALGDNPVGLGPPLASALSALTQGGATSPAQIQRILARIGLPATADPVTAVASLGALAEDPARMRVVLDAAPPGVEGLLEKLVWGPPFGKVGPGLETAEADAGPAVPAGSDASDTADASDIPDASGASGTSMADSWVRRDREQALAARRFSDPDSSDKPDGPDGPATDLGSTTDSDSLTPPTGSDAAASSASRVDPTLGSDSTASSDDAATDSLTRSATGEPAAPTAPAAAAVTSSESPVEWLLARGLLGRWGQDTVVLPREIAFYLRRHVFGTGLHRDLAPESPAMPLVRQDPRQADEAAASQAGHAPRRVEEVLDAWTTAPPGVLRSGGISIRDLRRTAVVPNVPEAETAFWIEVAYAAGLVAADLGSGFWLPTPAYDRWLDQSMERRWADLAGAWLLSDRCAGRVGLPDDRNRPVAPLSVEASTWAVTELRRDALNELAALPPGASTPLESLIDRLFWQRPRRSGPVARQLIEWILRESVWLGLITPLRGAAGVLTTQGRAVALGFPRDAAAAALSAALPEPVDHVLIQGDLTAIAPGPLAPALARELALAADVESAGAATVYRFSVDSVRRAFDSGRAADDLHALLAQHSLHPVPQALTYLIDDVARRHGRIRVGTTTSYVRSDNDTALAEILADRRTAHLRLRRIAPGVAVSELPPDEVLAALRVNGYAPMAETENGAAMPVQTTRASRRASSFHPYAPQRPVQPATDAIVALASALLDAG